MQNLSKRELQLFYAMLAMIDIDTLNDNLEKDGVELTSLEEVSESMLNVAQALQDSQ